MVGLGILREASCSLVYLWCFWGKMVFVQMSLTVDDTLEERLTRPRLSDLYAQSMHNYMQED
jgi:hypothetical protein